MEGLRLRRLGGAQLRESLNAGRGRHDREVRVGGDVGIEGGFAADGRGATFPAGTNEVDPNPRFRQSDAFAEVGGDADFDQGVARFKFAFGVFEFEVHRLLRAFAIFRAQRQQRAEQARRGGGFRRGDDGDVIGVEFFDFEAVEDAGGFFEGGREDRGEQLFGFGPAKVAVGEFFRGGRIGEGADLDRFGAAGRFGARQERSVSRKRFGFGGAGSCGGQPAEDRQQEAQRRSD